MHNQSTFARDKSTDFSGGPHGEVLEVYIREGEEKQEALGEITAHAGAILNRQRDWQGKQGRLDRQHIPGDPSQLSCSGAAGGTVDHEAGAEQLLEHYRERALEYL